MQYGYVRNGAWFFQGAIIIHHCTMYYNGTILVSTSCKSTINLLLGMQCMFSRHVTTRGDGSFGVGRQLTYRVIDALLLLRCDYCGSMIVSTLDVCVVYGCSKDWSTLDLQLECSSV